MKYHFFYDETEHSRKINYDTITAANYYDNFVASIVGWNSEDEKAICEKYEAFEAKYEFRKKNGELKSLTMKSKDFLFGFASLNKNTISFYEDLISLFDDKVILYLSVFSKIEYVINQLFQDYHHSLFVNIDSMKYSIIKAILIYHPERVIEAIYKEPREFVKELRLFFEARIEKNKVNPSLKKHENRAYEEILELLEDVDPISSLDWRYSAPFDGFAKLLNEINIQDYMLTIDQEGHSHNTANSAKEIGIKNVREGNSRDHAGIRMADMAAGLISKLMQSLKASLTSDYANGRVEKKLLGKEWFVLNDRQLNLYKRLYKIICIDHKHWYNTYSGIYSDDLISFISLLQYMSHFQTVDEIRENNFEMLPEHFNTFACENLQEHFERIQKNFVFKVFKQNRLPLEPLVNDSEEYFLNQRGAKVYMDTAKQPALCIKEGQNQYTVLSVGINRTGTPLVTISENGAAHCYRLPNDYYEWVMTMVGYANLGIKHFPTDVVFSLIDGKYYVDIL